jgi:hypothetical protein
MYGLFGIRYFCFTLVKNLMSLTNISCSETVVSNGMTCSSKVQERKNLYYSFNIAKLSNNPNSCLNVIKYYLPTNEF